MARTPTPVQPERRASGAPGPGGDGELPEDEATPRRRRRRLTGAAILTVVAVVVAVVVSRRGGDSDDATSGAGSTTTAPVEVRTLTQTERVDGTLDFGEAHDLAAGAAGTVTAVAAEGSTVERGGTLFSIDRHPTVLLLGDVPLYRDLTQGIDDGPDVAQLEENLAALGYTDDGAMVVDEQFDGSTSDAVAAWQDALGVEATGAVTRADAVFLPGPARTDTGSLEPGASVQAGATVVQYTAATRVVRAQLETTQADLVQAKDKVTITLPDGTEVAGTVTTIAATATTGDGSTGSQASTEGEAAGGTGSGSATGGGSTTESDTAMIDVTVSLDDQAAAQSYTTASVDVELTGRQAEDVLAVPVTALLALAGGGYALEVPEDDGTTRLIPVEPGLYADGYVEVSGDGISEGTEVVVAES
jgi:peptidoglycan hydrolase-like protein with peptidoglycan-binding domain